MSDKPITSNMAQSLQDLSSCIPKEPFIKLGTGSAPELNYNLPQSSCFSVNAPAELEIPSDYFKPECHEEPKDHFWNRTLNLGEMQIRQELQDQLKGVTGPGIITGFKSGSSSQSLMDRKMSPSSSVTGTKLGLESASTLSVTQTKSGDEDELIEQIQCTNPLFLGQNFRIGFVSPALQLVRRFGKGSPALQACQGW